MPTITLTLPSLHSSQAKVVREARRFNVACCGRRYGKTVLGINRLVPPALAGLPVAYFAPTYKMMSDVWRDMSDLLRPVTERVNVQEHRLELVTGGKVDMWSLDRPDAARGRKYATIVVDEAAMVPTLVHAWPLVLRPTLADYIGEAWFLSTPRGKNFFSHLVGYGQRGVDDWASWQLPTSANPHIKASEIEAMRRSMSARHFQQEIEAQILEDDEGALWKRPWIDQHRVDIAPPLQRIVVAIDPSATATGDEAGIIVAGKDAAGHAYVLHDASVQARPEVWASAAVSAYHQHRGDCLLAEQNNGGEMVRVTIGTVPNAPPVKLVHASRGKATRAEPIALLYEQGKVHHAGVFESLENELCNWAPGGASPNRLDALVWALSELMLGGEIRMRWLE